MDSQELKTMMERAFLSGDKQKLYEVLSNNGTDITTDVLWTYMEEMIAAPAHRKELEEIKEKIKEMNNKSGQRVRCLEILPDRRVLVKLGPIAEEVMLAPNVDVSKLKRGIELLIVGTGEGRIIAEIRGHDIKSGRITKIQKVLDDDRVTIEDGGNHLVLSVADGVECKSGDEVRYDFDSAMILEVIKVSSKAAFSLSSIPKITFDDIKGLEKEKRYLRERIVYPTAYKEKFEKYGLKAVRGVLLHGPPGTGKSMFAEAIFNEIKSISGQDDNSGFFLIKGPAILDKWAGRSEETIRSIFEAARSDAKKRGIPSIIFWDELESVAKKRKDKVSYSPESTIVPTLLTEIQGACNHESDVIFIGATNMPELLDQALLRPGRLGDAILCLPRPNKEGALEILRSALKQDDLPSELKTLIDAGLEQRLIEHIYNNESPIAVATLQNGKITKIMRQSLVNGALFTQIGNELVRSACMAEIYGNSSNTIPEAIQMLDNILLNQLGVLDSGVKSGFGPDTTDIIIDISAE